MKNLTIVLFFYNFSSFSFYFSVVCVICIAFFLYIYLLDYIRAGRGGKKENVHCIGRMQYGEITNHDHLRHLNT